ncbi:MAG: peroxiredoxin-like family protein [Desulfobacteraceae bacterium]|nr:peroxiredoxin-like family protein [Desulfobacteraceae bacterium]
MNVKKKLDAAAVGLVAIGSGSPQSAKKFVDDFHFTGEMYVNRDLSVYKAFDLERGITKTVGLSSLIKGVQTMKKGFRQGRSAGDLWQQGGLFVLGPGERLLFAHRDKFAGDHADLQQALPKI